MRLDGPGWDIGPDESRGGDRWGSPGADSRTGGSDLGAATDAATVRDAGTVAPATGSAATGGPPVLGSRHPATGSSRRYLLLGLVILLGLLGGALAAWLSALP